MHRLLPYVGIIGQAVVIGFHKDRRSQDRRAPTFPPTTPAKATLRPAAEEDLTDVRAQRCAGLVRLFIDTRPEDLPLLEAWLLRFVDNAAASVDAVQCKPAPATRRPPPLLET